MGIHKKGKSEIKSLEPDSKIEKMTTQIGNGQTFENFGSVRDSISDVREEIGNMDPEYNTCQCQFGTLNDKNKIWAKEKFPDHQLVTYGKNNYKAIYKPGTGNGSAIILICDALGAEMSGSRTLMEA